jgi:hypothetical protein
MEEPAWLKQVDELLKSGKPLRREKHLLTLKKLHSNFDAYLDNLLDLVHTVRVMKEALGKRIHRLDYEGY